MVTHPSILAWRIPWQRSLVGTDYGAAKSWTRLSAARRTAPWHLQRLFPGKLPSRASFAGNTAEPGTPGHWHFPALLKFTTGILSLNRKFIKFYQAFKGHNAPFQPRETPYINGHIQSKPGWGLDFQLPPRGREFGVTVKNLFNIELLQIDACLYLFSSVQFSHSVMSNPLRPHEPHHARPPCPSPTPGIHPNPCPSSRWCHPTISSSVVPFSSCPQYFPASGSFQMSQLFTIRQPKYWSFSCDT